MIEDAKRSANIQVNQKPQTNNNSVLSSSDMKVSFVSNGKKPPLASVNKKEYWAPVTRKQKFVVRDNFDSLYSGVKVCKECYDIYLLLKDYFD